MERAEKELSQSRKLGAGDMIFVTFGTHEHGFDRLVKEIDRLKGANEITEDVFIQGTMGKYCPEYCTFKDMLGYEDFCSKIRQARIVITHGGAGSIMMSFHYGKIPIVVPRMHKFGEHVDDHQVRFAEKLESEGAVLAVYDIGRLKEVIQKYDSFVNNYAARDSSYKGRKNLIMKLDEYCSNF